MTTMARNFDLAADVKAIKKPPRYCSFPPMHTYSVSTSLSYLYFLSRLGNLSLDKDNKRAHNPSARWKKKKRDRFLLEIMEGALFRLTCCPFLSRVLSFLFRFRAHFSNPFSFSPRYFSRRKRITYRELWFSSRVTLFAFLGFTGAVQPFIEAAEKNT